MSEQAPTWEECEDVFWEMQGCFAKDMPKYRELDAKYQTMLASWEASQNHL